MKKALMAAVVASTLAIGTAVFAADAKILFKEDFESDLSKWTCNEEPIADQAIQANVVAHSGEYSINLFGPSRDGIVLYAPEFDLPSGYVEAWFLDPTGDRSAWVDQAYLLIEGDSGTKATCQIGQHGNPVTSEEQTKYALFFDGDFGFKPSETPRSKGWHKFAFELTPDGDARIYIDDKLEAEYYHDDWASGIKKVGLLSYYSNKRDGAIGTPIHESYWDDIVVYDKKP